MSFSHLKQPTLYDQNKGKAKAKPKILISCFIIDYFKTYKNKLALTKCIKDIENVKAAIFNHTDKMTNITM